MERVKKTELEGVPAAATKREEWISGGCDQGNCTGSGDPGSYGGATGVRCLHC